MKNKAGSESGQFPGQGIMLPSLNVASMPAASPLIAIGTISTAVTTTVTLGSAAYTGTLTVTGTGSIAPTGNGLVAVYGSTAGVSLTNFGTISGGNGYTYSPGGIGVLLTAPGSVTNYGTINGGSSGANSDNYTGGAGVYLHGGGSLTNDGVINGGASGYYVYRGAPGGRGVVVGGGQVTNNGTIIGGTGSSGGAGANGGYGVYLNNGTLINNGTIIGGAPGHSYDHFYAYQGYAMLIGRDSTLVIDPGAVFSGEVVARYAGDTLALGGTTAATLTGLGTQFNNFAAITFEAGANWTAEGTTGALAYGQAITGFAPGDKIVLDGFAAMSETYVAGTGVELGNSDTTITLALTGNYHADKFSYTTQNGNTTLQLTQGVQIGTISTAVTTSVTLDGDVYAGTLTVTGTGSIGPIGYGGLGVFGNEVGVSLVNFGNIAGGSGLYYEIGGDGVLLTAGGNITNNGNIIGGNGGAGAATDSGGSGVVLSSGGTLTNDGLIKAGAGGSYFYGAAGSTGVVVNNGLVTNNGTIVGGTGANGYAPGNGGTGVYVNNATLINNGTITGGATGSTSGTYFHASPGYAVAIGADSTLVIDPGSVINGQVQAKGYNDTLALGGDTGASFSGLGTQFTGFAAVEVEKGANWTLKGADTLDDGASLTVDGRLGVSGSLTAPSPVTVDKGGLLRAGAGATVLMAGLTLNGGSIAEAGNGTLVVGASAAYAQPGALTVQAGYVVSGFGTVGGTAGNMVIDDGTITASGGTLNVALAVTGIGTLALDSGGTVLAHGAVSVADIVFNSSGNETLQFLSTASPTGTVTGFAAGDTIILGLRAKTFNFANDTLSLLGKGGIVLETLTFGSGYSAGDFVLSKVGHVSEITFAPPAHAEAGGLTHIDPLSDTMMHWGMAHNPMA